MGSRRAPIEFRPPRTCRRQESESRGADPAPPGTGRNSRGAEWGLSRNRDPSGSSRMGTEWGLGPLTIEQTTEDVTTIHRLAASRLRGQRLSRHRRPARAPSGDPRRPAPRSKDAAEGAINTAPNPGTSRRGALGGRGSRTSARTASERDRSAGKDRGVREGALCRMARRRALPAARGRRASGKEGGEHGHELKIRRPDGVRARALARRRAFALP
jgi:hypothetical protein